MIKMVMMMIVPIMIRWMRMVLVVMPMIGD